jgi:hypothetical protein
MSTATTQTAPIDPGAQSTPAATAVPAPSEPAAAPGPLARILTPVEPARPARPLGTTAAMGQTADIESSKTGPVSAGPAKDGGRGSVVAALGHALAERIRRSGTSVKRTHAITETRVSGATSNTTHANKAERLAKHDGQHRTNRDAKLADLNNKVHQRHGRDNRDVKKADATDAKTTAARTAKADSTRGATSTTATARDAGPFGAKAANDTDRAAASTDTRAAKGTTATKPADSVTPGGAARSSKTAAAKAADPKGMNAKTNAATKAPAAAAKGASITDKATAKEPAAGELRTRPAREAGYRDGTRVATVAGHARAYRDGARDGWDDRTAADKAEGRTMTGARIRNATRTQPKAAPKMTPASGSTVDLAKKTAPAAAPVQVTAVNDKAISFTAAAGGTQHTMSRGEVRTLKAFERRMAEKKPVLGRIAERSKDYRVQAEELAARAQRLSEDAKSVEGGAKIVALLSRLSERSQVLRHRAEDIERSATRGSEAVNVLAANAETRHGGIYRAVVDSPLTAPAEREFYADKDGR